MATDENTTSADAVEDVVGQLWKKWGKGAIVRMDAKPVSGVDAISTGNIAIDKVLGVGGLPKGRITEIFGPESCGKTTLALQVAAQANKNGGLVTYIDTENALDMMYAQALGVKTDKFYLVQPDSGEDALGIARDVVQSNKFSVVVIDSVAALTPLVEIKGEMTDANVGVQGKMMSKGMRIITSALADKDTVVIFINQLRQKIGVMYGDPNVTTGGMALPYHSSVRLKVNRSVTAANRKLDEGGEVIGNLVTVEVIKNKVAPPFRKCELTIDYGRGFSNERSVLDVGVECEVIKKKGHYYYDHNGELIGQGMDKAILALEEDPERMAALLDVVRAAALS